MANKNDCDNYHTREDDDDKITTERDSLVTNFRPEQRNRSSSQSRLSSIVQKAMRLKVGNGSSLHSTPNNSNHNLTSVSVHGGTRKSPGYKRKLWAISGRKSAQKAQEKNSDTSQEEENHVMCLLSDGPTWILKLASRGNLDEFTSFYHEHPEKLAMADDKGATVIHHAITKNRFEIINYVLMQPEGRNLLDEPDNNLQTPLHWAASNNQKEAVEFLLNIGANPRHLDHIGEAAIHKVIRCDRVETFKVFLRHKGVVNINMRTSTGTTPLHLAASVDCVEVAELILEAGGKMCLKCNQGFRPIHEAALRGSKKVMSLILEKCEKYGYTREMLLSFNDKEHNSPLHTAVTGGNADAIKMCLEYGARLDSRQQDNSTPLHLVCAQGIYDIIHLMFETSPEHANTALHVKDNLQQTPLHKAAMFDHRCTVRYLVEKGADMNQTDKDKRSPILLAASREAWYTMRALVDLGANLRIKDKLGRNILHIVIMKGGDIQKLAERRDDDICCKCGECAKQLTEMTCWQKSNFREMLDEVDDFGCTPLHYACKKGNLASLHILMTQGVSARIKSIKKQSPLHFAAMYGRYNACVRLLNSQQGPNIMNEKDDSGMTPVHLGALYGHVKVVQLFLNRGAVLHRNFNNETALHMAAYNGYTRTSRLLIEVNNMMLNQVNLDGDTALHIAARKGHSSLVETLLNCDAEILRNKKGQTFFTEAISNQNREVPLAVVQHKRWEEAMQAFECDKDGVMKRIPFLLLIQHLPDVCMAALDRCIVTSDCDKKSKDYCIKYLFKYLQPSLDVREDLKKLYKEKAQNEASKSSSIHKIRHEFRMQFQRAVALPALNKMVEFNRVDCLRHPVSVAYLRMKWNGYGRLFHTMNLFFYMCVLLPLTYLVCSIDSSNHHHAYANQSTNQTTFDEAKFQKNFTTFGFIMAVLLAVCCVAQIIKELIQMLQQKSNYFGDFTNLVEWVLYTSSLLFVIPLFTHYPVHWQFEMGAVAIFLAWFNLLLFLQRFDLSGIYVVMFIEILRTLIQVVLVFSFLIVAFGLAFYVIMQNEVSHAHRKPFLSMMQVFVMTMGEIGYVERFLDPLVDEDPNTLHFALPSLILLDVFFILMPILFINLLIGLAVGDIAAIQCNAVLQRLAMQVQLHTDIEGKLPTSILRMVDHAQIENYPNNNACGFWGKLFKALSNRMQSDYGESGDTTDHNVERVYAELNKQKQRIKCIQTSLDKQHELLRLIVQKMEIKSEAENQDEGWQPNDGAPNPKESSTLHNIVATKMMASRVVKYMGKS